MAPMASPKLPDPRISAPCHRRNGLGARLPLLITLAVVCACLGTANITKAKENYMTDPRVLLIRGLDSEIAVAKIPLPAGKKGLVIDREGAVEQKSAAEQFRNHGMSVKAGMPVEITKIDFHSKKIIFEINGGGKNGKKWYQHIEIGTGPGAMQPLVPGQPKQSETLGSYITLLLPREGAVPTTEQAKQLLSPILDFHRQTPTVLYSPKLPPKFKKAIKKHVVMPGMDKSAVLSARGEPDRKVRDVKPDGTEEVDWIYGLPPHCLFVVFENGKVKKVTQY